METRDLGPVLYETDGPIARLILNWPEKANAQSSAMVHTFDDALTLADRDYDVKVLIIKANGRGFCAGHAVGGDPYPEFTENRERWDSVWKAQADLFLIPTQRLWEFRKPTIAQVHGYALGGGTYWALLPDITIASDDAFFQMPLVQGLGFPGGETMIEPWVFMNWKRAVRVPLHRADGRRPRSAEHGHGQPRRAPRRSRVDGGGVRRARRQGAAVHAHGHQAAGVARRGSSWACACTGRCRPT